jgi:hypothetical protein
VKGYLTSYAGLFAHQVGDAPTISSIEIPLIQRDYAQGRTDADVAEIRSNFLDTLLSAIAGGDPVGLDFVYGKVDGNTLKPLDGQQRLTTLFLLHWYIASMADELQTGAPWIRFSYATRFGARRFCERLSQQPLPRTECQPSRWIIDQPWYLHVWRDDPTITAMLVMIDDIHATLSSRFPDLDPKEAWKRLTVGQPPAISFYLLPLDDIVSDEELYIKMNSRGKPLTPFENFKARFEQDIGHSGRSKEFAHKVDGSWSDLLWPLHGGDFIVDDELLRYVDYITEVCEFREGSIPSEWRLGPRARSIFGAANDLANDHLDFLFHAFDAWGSHENVASTFDAVFATALPGAPDYDPDKVVLFGVSSTNLLELCVHGFRSGVDQNPNFARPQGLLLYGVLLHVIKHIDDFGRRIRVLRNLIAASEDEIRRSAMPALLTDVEQVIINGDLEAVTTFSSNQVEDEKLKRQLLAQYPHLSGAVFRLEDNPILRGTLSAFEFDATTFTARAEAFEAAFAHPQHWVRLTGALLATGDYQRKPARWTAWQFGTGSPRHESVWRSLLTNASRHALTGLREVLGRFLGKLANSDVEPASHFDSVMGAWVEHRERARNFDWRYYLVKYESMRGGESGIYYGVDGELGYMLCMLHKTQRNSRYRDPVLLELWRTSGVGDRVRDPWFTGYETSERWLSLINSGVALRCVNAGYEVRPPEDAAHSSRFQEVCSRFNTIETDDGKLMLPIGQTDHGQGLVDSVDRVIEGARFLRALVAAGL